MSIMIISVCRYMRLAVLCIMNLLVSVVPGMFACLSLLCTGCVQSTESGFHDFPGPFMSIFHVFSGLFNPVDIKQVRFFI